MWKELSKQERLGDLMRAMTLGMTFAVGVAVFSFAGFLIDQRRGGGILFTLIGLCLGLALGAYETWKVVTLLNQQAADHARRQPQPPAGPPADDNPVKPS